MTNCLSVILPLISPMRLKHPQKSKKTTCSFCGDDGTPLSPLSHQLTNWNFLFPIYCCHECVGDGKLTYLVDIIKVIELLENLHVSIAFNGHPIVNPSDLYIPFMNISSGNLQFLCMSNKCSMTIFCDTTGSRETNLFHNSTIHGCVINPSSGEITTESISIAKIILGVDLLNRILRGESQCSYIQPICDFHALCPDVSPRIRNFSMTDPNSILKLFSLVVSGIYSDGAIYAVLNGEMKEYFLKFITDSMISMTAFMRKNGFNDKLPELKEAHDIPKFLVKNYGRAGFSFNYQDIICQNFRNFLKLFRKILRYLSYVDDSQLSIDLFQYCRFLYATLHVSNREIYHRFTRQVPFQKLSPYDEYLERYHMSASPFCVEIFATVPASEIELDNCAICLNDKSASVIGKCPQHNICCLGCFPRVVKLSTCPTCREKYFLP
jgi:hypothetical protein